MSRKEKIYESNDSQLVFDLPEALSEIRALRQHKRILAMALDYIAGHIGGEIGMCAAGALDKVGGTSFVPQTAELTARKS